MWTRPRRWRSAVATVVDNLAWAGRPWAASACFPTSRPTSSTTQRGMTSRTPRGAPALWRRQVRHHSPRSMIFRTRAFDAVVCGSPVALALSRPTCLPDVGTNDADMKTIAVENGSQRRSAGRHGRQPHRPAKRGCGGTSPRWRRYSRRCPASASAPVQHAQVPPRGHSPCSSRLRGGRCPRRAHAERAAARRQVVGISDAAGYLYDEAGLPVDALFRRWRLRAW